MDVGGFVKAMGVTGGFVEAMGITGRLVEAMGVRGDAAGWWSGAISKRPFLLRGSMPLNRKRPQRNGLQHISYMLKV